MKCQFLKMNYSTLFLEAQIRLVAIARLVIARPASIRKPSKPAVLQSEIVGLLDMVEA
jgi:hypothetical protein